MEVIKNKMNGKEKMKKMIVVVIMVSLSSGIYMDLSISNFKISFAIILFGVFMFSFEELNSITTGAFTAAGVYILRVFTHILKKGDFFQGMYFYFPEIFFYFTYAVFLYFIIRKAPKKNLAKLILCLILCDYCANFIELLIREQNNIHFIYNLDVKKRLFLIAVVRSCILWVSINFVKYYNMLLLNEEHEDRYRKLLLMTSRLKTETYWMTKTMDNLEKVMAEAYELFEEITLDIQKETWASKAVNIAKDVHEIKKEYGIVVRGVEEVTKDKDEDKGMYLKDLINILEQSLNNEIKYMNLNINLKLKIENNFYTEKHYFLMSIFRNMIMNAMEALGGKDNGVIFLEEREEAENYKFTISDNGCGIKEDELEFVFSPGYSTKINYGTGEINRGLGLSIVKHIVEEKLKGEIQIKSEINKGTVFYINIPKATLGGKNNENFNC